MIGKAASIQRSQSEGLSPADILSPADAVLTGTCSWPEPVPSQNPGVYIVSLHPDPENGRGLASAPVDHEAMGGWLQRCPGLIVNGRRPGADELAVHLARWWLANTSILYIGKAEGQSLRKRVGQYYDTPLGAPGPHGGGYWLKTLSVLDDVSVHYTETSDNASAGIVEDELINMFLRLYEDVSQSHPEPELPLPWANLQVDRPPPRRRRDHGLPSLQKQQQPPP